MKPLRLCLRAFGPYLEETEIGFTLFEEPGIFLISGPTGGGKTALLDAMSFALFGRATGGRRDFASMRCMNAGEDDPTVVEYDFSLGGESYRFRRTRYSHVNQRTKEWELRETHECFQLENGEARLLESGSESAVRRRAEELLHLTAEQFSQVIVLPQGEFLRLLRANSRDKGEMLRTLFSAEPWKAVTDRLNSRAKKLEDALSQAQARKGSLLQKEGLETTGELEKAGKEAALRESALRAGGKALAKRTAETEALLQAAETWEKLRGSLEEAERQEKAAREKKALLDRQAPANLERREKAGKFRKEAVALARETARLAERREELRRAWEAGRQAAEARQSVAVIRRELEGAGARSRELEARIQKGNRFLQECQNAAQALPGLLERRQGLEKARDAYGELARRREALEGAGRALASAEQEAERQAVLCGALSRQLEQQEALLRHNAALGLARTLEPGAPCPVCGSREHPAPAHGEEAVLDETALEALRAGEKEARQEALRKAAHREACRADQEKAQAAVEEQAQLCKLSGLAQGRAERELPGLQEQIAAAKRDADRLEAARGKLSALEREKEDCIGRQAAEKEKLSALEAKAEELERRRAEAEQGCAGLDPEALDRLLAENQERYGRLEKAAAELTEQAEQAERERERAGEALALAGEALEKARREAEGFPAPWETPPALDGLRAAAAALREEALKHSEELGKAAQKALSLQASLDAVRKLDAETGEWEQAYGRTARLARFLSGSNPAKLPILQYVLSIMLDEVLVSANRFFSTLSRGRYALRLMDRPKGGNALSGLDLEVLDGASALPRSIETLSGGEQFLASLSLAFGLSEVVQNHSGAVRLDSLFIDEGFGSLDGETLDTAMKALAMLRGGGRLVGIISHVSELKNRVPDRVEVTRDSAGFSHARAVPGR